MTNLNPAQGETRSSRQPTHLLQTPDTFVRTPMPGLDRGLAIVHASPALGAGFLMFTAELEPGGALAPSQHSRFVFVLEGHLHVTASSLHEPLRPGSYAFSPGTDPMTLSATTATRALILDKRHEPLQGYAPPTAFAGHESTIAATALNGDPGIQVRALMPPTYACDFAVNTMTYAPAAALSQVEIHYMEHGLLMLEGSGPYLLGDVTHHTHAGDFIWMAPFCPQWFRASPAAPAKYLIYKNFNRIPSL